LAPGMLLIICEDDMDEIGEDHTTRILPPTEWVQDHKETLEHVIGDEELYESVLAAAADVSKSFRTEFISYPQYDTDEGSAEDFTACRKDCGYCGHCTY